MYGLFHTVTHDLIMKQFSPFLHENISRMHRWRDWMKGDCPLLEVILSNLCMTAQKKAILSKFIPVNKEACNHVPPPPPRIRFVIIIFMLK